MAGLKIKKSDQVVVTRGRDRGERGGPRVLRSALFDGHRDRICGGTRPDACRGGRLMGIAQATSTVSWRTARATALRSTSLAPT